MRRVLLSLLLLGACTKAGPTDGESAPTAQAETVIRVDSVPAVSPTPPAPAPTPPPKVTPKASARVELTAVTLADDCGGAPPWTGPRTPKPASRSELAPRAKGDSARGARARQRCEQTSMQLAITATDVMSLRVKSVKLYDEDGALVGTLTATKPTKWSAQTSRYEAWNESVSAGSTINVSYVLSQPSWGHVTDRWNKTFTLKAIVSVGGVDQTAERDVSLSAPTALPPNVRT